jgi:hypothetical protein
MIVKLFNHWLVRREFSWKEAWRVVIVRDSVSRNPNSLNHLDVNMTLSFGKIKTKQSLVQYIQTGTDFSVRELSIWKKYVSAIKIYTYKAWCIFAYTIFITNRGPWYTQWKGWCSLSILLVFCILILCLTI